MSSIARRAFGALLLAVVAVIAITGGSAFAGGSGGGGGDFRSTIGHCSRRPEHRARPGYRHHRVEGRREQQCREGDRGAGRGDPEARRQPRLRPRQRADRQGRGGRSPAAASRRVDLDEIIPLDDPRPGRRGAIRRRRPPPGAARRDDNPYMPIGDTGAAQFMAAQPDLGRPRRDDRHPRHAASRSTTRAC